MKMDLPTQKAEVSSGWQARLELEFAARPQQTILATNRHYGPLRLQRPLYPEGALCHGYILHPPGGIVGGDRLEIDIRVKSGAAALVTTPGATKFYRSAKARAVQTQHLRIETDASLEWLPQESIFFPGARAHTTTRVDLAAEAAFMGWEIMCLGLPANRQRFETGSFSAGLEINRDKKPLLHERLRVFEGADLDRVTGLRGFAVSATFVTTGVDGDMLGPLGEIRPPGSQMLSGLTLLDDLLVARYLGNATDAARAYFQALWAWLRPHILGREACVPRIWAT